MTKFSFGEINQKQKKKLVMHVETWTQLVVHAQLWICGCSLDDYNWLWLTKF